MTRIIAIGDTIPDLALIDADGRPWRLRDQVGRPLVLILHRHLA